MDLSYLPYVALSAILLLLASQLMIHRPPWNACNTPEDTVRFGHICRYVALASVVAYASNLVAQHPFSIIAYLLWMAVLLFLVSFAAWFVVLRHIGI